MEYAKGITIKKGKFSLKCGINVKNLTEWLNQFVNEKGYVNVEIKERKEAGKFGETHYVTLDEWKPTKDETIPCNTVETGKKKTMPDLSDTKELDNLPF